jgi:hypothetical protein
LDFLGGTPTKKRRQAPVWGFPIAVDNLSLTDSSPTTLTWDEQTARIGNSMLYDLLAGDFTEAGPDLGSRVCLHGGPVGSLGSSTRDGSSPVCP